MIKEAIQLLAQGNNLSKQQAYECMNEIMAGEASQIQMASYLTALSLKGETIDEITGSAGGMREHCIKIIEKKFSQQNKVLGNIEKFAENQGLQTFFFNEKVS